MLETLHTTLNILAYIALALVVGAYIFVKCGGEIYLHEEDD